jgi:hypothetical protein
MPEPINVKMDFDAETVDDMIDRLTVAAHQDAAGDAEAGEAELAQRNSARGEGERIAFGRAVQKDCFSWKRKSCATKERVWTTSACWSRSISPMRRPAAGCGIPSTKVSVMT